MNILKLEIKKLIKNNNTNLYLKNSLLKPQTNNSQLRLFSLHHGNCLKENTSVNVKFETGFVYGLLLNICIFKI
jgi:hypothetical protein